MDNVTSLISNTANNALEFIKDNPLQTTALALGVGAVTGGVIGSAITTATSSNGSNTINRTSSHRRRKRITHTKRGWKQDRKRRSKQKWELYYWKHRKHKKRHSGKRKGIHYARKTGQPYIILSSGKAKFIKGKRRRT